MRSSFAKRLLVLMVPMMLLVAPRLASAKGGPVIERVSGADIEMLLKQEGYAAEKVRDGVWKFKMMGMTVLFFSKGTNLQLYAGFKKKPGCDVINKWNKSRRFSRAYLDNVNDAVIESDMDLEGGVTMGSIKEFIRTFQMSLGAFLKEVVQR